MVMPFDAVTVLHNGFHRDLTEIDDAVYKTASHGGDLSLLVDRLKWFTQILDLHAQGEEEVVFPAVENAAPFVAPLFVTDHRELDTMCEGLQQVVDAPDELAAARATAVLHSHMRIHLAKEDTHFYTFAPRTVEPVGASSNRRSDGRQSTSYDGATVCELALCSRGPGRSSDHDDCVEIADARRGFRRGQPTHPGRR